MLVNDGVAYVTGAPKDIVGHVDTMVNSTSCVQMHVGLGIGTKEVIERIVASMNMNLNLNLNPEIIESR